MTTERSEAAQPTPSTPMYEVGSKLITVTAKQDTTAKVWVVTYVNGVKLGEISAAEDGYYVFWPEVRGGFWAQEVLEDIATVLKDMNAEWHQEVMEGCL